MSSGKRYYENQSNSYSRESGDDEPPNKKSTLRSTVVLSNISIKTKDDLIKLQNNLKGTEQRNKRMFGVIIGTLQQFKTEDKEKSSTSQAIHRKELEKKIEIKNAEELKKIIDERKQFEEQRYKQYRINRIVHQKIKLSEEFESWKAHQLQLKRFIRTQNKPFIYFIPKSLDEASQKLIENTSVIIDDIIAKKQSEVQAELDVFNAEMYELNVVESKSLQQPSDDYKTTEIKPSDLLNVSIDSDELDENKSNVNVRVEEDEDEDDEVKHNKASNDDAKMAIEVFSDDSRNADIENGNDVSMKDQNLNTLNESTVENKPFSPSESGGSNDTKTGSHLEITSTTLSLMTTETATNGIQIGKCRNDIAVGLTTLEHHELVSENLLQQPNRNTNSEQTEETFLRGDEIKKENEDQKTLLSFKNQEAESLPHKELPINENNIEDPIINDLTLSQIKNETSSEIN